MNSIILRIQGMRLLLHMAHHNPNSESDLYPGTTVGWLCLDVLGISQLKFEQLCIVCLH